MASPLILPFLTEAAYAQWAGAERRILYEAQRVEAAAPLVFPRPEPDYYDLSPLRYDFPAVTLTPLRDVLLRGKSNLLTAPEAMIRHGLIDMQADVTPEEFYARLVLADGGRSATWTGTDPFNVSYMAEAAGFVDGVAFNYAHWMTEVLPRIAALARHAGASVPLIVDTDLHPNLLRSIAMVAGPDVVIHRLAPDQVFRVGRLHNVSPAGYVPFKLRETSEAAFSHGLFGGHALGAMVEQLRGGLAPGAAGQARPRLFIRRNSTLRRLVNEAEVEAVLVGLGFQVIEPERLSLEDQIAVYSGAGMIVGATGAALANVMFCPPDCPTVVIMPRFRELAYWYWRHIAAAAGAGPVLLALGEQIEPYDDPFHPLAVHQDFRVEVKDVLDAIEAADALRR